MWFGGGGRGFYFGVPTKTSFGKNALLGWHFSQKKAFFPKEVSGVLLQVTKNKTYAPKNTCSGVSKDHSHKEYLAYFCAT